MVSHYDLRQSVGAQKAFVESRSRRMKILRSEGLGAAPHQADGRKWGVY